MRRLGALALGICLLLPGSGWAADAPEPLSLSPSQGRWIAFGMADDNGAEVSYRADSIRAVSDGKVSVITKRVYFKDVDANGVAYRIEIGQVAIDCAAERYGPMDAALYNQAGLAVSASHLSPDELTYYAIQPGALVDKVRQIVCAAPPLSPSPSPQAETVEVSSGTGWMTTKGYLVTASHVIAGAETIELYQNGGLVGRAKVVTDDPANDVAILQPTLAGRTHVAIPLGVRPAPLGSPVFTIGYPAPDAMGMSVKVTAGEISAVAGLDVASNRTDDVRLMQISIPIQSGNSGGPVVDSAGRAVGIVISKLDRTSDEEVAQNVNYALKSAYVRSLLAELPDVGGYRPAGPPASRTDLVGSLQDAVFMIVTTQHKTKAPAP